MNNVSKKEKMFYIIVGMILVTAISICMSVRVQSRTREAILFDKRNYEVAEASYKEQVRKVLEHYECYDSGLTMTRVVSLDEEREYSMQIYHKKHHDMEPGLYEYLQEELAEFKVNMPDGSEYEVTLIFGI